MQEWLTKFLKQEQAIPRPLYSLEQENELLHGMVRKIAVGRNTYRIENQRLLDENARLRCKIELIVQSHDRFFRTRDIEHHDDIERILEYDGTDDC